MAPVVSFFLKVKLLTPSLGLETPHKSQCHYKHLQRKETTHTHISCMKLQAERQGERAQDVKLHRKRDKNITDQKARNFMLRKRNNILLDDSLVPLSMVLQCWWCWWPQRWLCTLKSYFKVKIKKKEQVLLEFSPLLSKNVRTIWQKQRSPRELKLENLVWSGAEWGGEVRVMYRSKSVFQNKYCGYGVKNRTDWKGVWMYDNRDQKKTPWSGLGMGWLDSCKNELSHGGWLK